MGNGSKDQIFLNNGSDYGDDTTCPFETKLEFRVGGLAMEMENGSAGNTLSIRHSLLTVEGAEGCPTCLAWGSNLVSTGLHCVVSNCLVKADAARGVLNILKGFPRGRFYVCVSISTMML